MGWGKNAPLCPSWEPESGTSFLGSGHHRQEASGLEDGVGGCRHGDASSQACSLTHWLFLPPQRCLADTERHPSGCYGHPSSDPGLGWGVGGRVVATLLSLLAPYPSIVGQALCSNSAGPAGQLISIIL